MKKTPLLIRTQRGQGAMHQNLQFSGQGIAPDVFSETGLATFPEANKTLLEEGVYGKDGMYPAPGYVAPVTAGSGGAGSFLTSISAPKERQ